MHNTTPFLIPSLLLVVQGCIFVPVTTQTQEQGCRGVTRQMKLQPVQIATLGRCRGDECAAVLVIAGAAAATSAVVSGSIVVVGNAVYWLEKQGACKRED